MAKAGMGVLLVALMGAASAACGSPSASPATEPAETAVGGDADEATATNASDASGVPAAGPDGAEDTATDEETDATAAASGDGTDGNDGDDTGAVTEEGTDSAVTSTPAEASPEVEALVSEFGQAYLAYDYRVAHDEQVEGLRPLVSPDLFDQLAVPLPAGLAESLVAEQRVVIAEPAGVEPIEPGVFAVSFEVTVSAGEPVVTTTEPRVLVVSVGADQLVTDVR